MCETRVREAEAWGKNERLCEGKKAKEAAPGFSLAEVLAALVLVALLAAVGLELLTGVAHLTAVREEREGAYRLARAIGDLYRHLPAQDVRQEAQNFVATGCGENPEFSPLPEKRKAELPAELLGTYVPCIRFASANDGYLLLVVRVQGRTTGAEERVFLPAAPPGVGTR
ncbi:prepilin-type N-terminal cleavage/methylation domain-containing protein [Brockia lithotrophica]|uniref:Prepilin-type N-terminal cleavage/methylation domain-containing protein n=1 Tax=Brockia lithotrophica TaxID=933949 RepID=A0A660L1J8_9BACL|nr:prepilin-type N-terminal cleavage/methylation domain-containing protein [Brockia lithotrophica]RKQ84727.1 prepilin-type N-terminal cleavage/methylation domain-containing protein [Brockia lithotrophica]